jgi:hypothetical protein
VVRSCVGQDQLPCSARCVFPWEHVRPVVVLMVPLDAMKLADLSDHLQNVSMRCVEGERKLKRAGLGKQRG